MTQPRTRRSICRAILAGLAVLLLGWQGIAAKDMVAGEYAIKAAFLYNFTKFVDWPGGETTPAAAPFVIAVIGDDPLGPALDEAVRSETVHGRPLTVQRIKSGQPVGDCAILFISQSEAGHLDAIIRQTGGRPILTVSDVEGSAAKGVMINFVLKNKSVKFEINRQRAEQAHLKISSKLLGLATIVESKE